MTLYKQMFCWAALLALGHFSMFGQSVPSNSGINLQPGVVVEQVTHSRGGDKAGIKEGDVLLRWSRGEMSGAIASPFDLDEIEIEQEPRGAVTIEGLRGNDHQKQTWVMEQDTWKITARPQLAESLLTIYREARELEKANKPEAIARMRAAAAQARTDSQAWLSSWLLLQAAQSATTKHQWKEADAAYAEAVQQAESSPQIKTQLLRAWAKAYQQRSDWVNAEKHYQESLAESKKLDAESLMMAALIINLGDVALNQGDMVKAEQYYQQSLQLAQKLGPESLAAAKCLDNLGIASWYQGDLVNAEKYYQQSLQIDQKVAPESLAVATMLERLGTVAFDHGDLAQAENYHQHSLQITEKLTPGELAVGLTLNSLGNVADDRGDVAQAEKDYQQAVQIIQKVDPENLQIPGIFSNLGNVAYERGDLALAAKYYQQALKMTRQHYHGSPRESMQVAGILSNLGMVTCDLGDLTEARSYHQQSLQLIQKVAPESWDVANDFRNLGNLEEQHGDLALAEKYFQHALDIYQKLAPDGLDMAYSLQGLGNVASKHNDLAQAQNYYEKALAIREKLAPGSSNHAESLAALASIQRRKQQPDAATRLYEKALNALESQTGRLGGSEETRADFRASHEDYYREYADLLISQKKPELAFDVLERSRARTLLELLASAHMDIRKGGDPALLRRERSLAESISAKSSRRIQLLSDEHAEKQIAEMEKETQALLAQYNDVEEQIRLNSPEYAALTQPKLLSAQAVQQQLLDSGTVLLEYSLGKEGSYVFVVTPDSLTAYPLPKQDEVEGTAKRAYASLTARNKNVQGESQAQREERIAAADKEYRHAIFKLSKMVLGPVAEQIAGKRLLIVGDGALQYIPFAALPEPGDAGHARPLVIGHEVVNLPSASVLAELRRMEEGRSEPARAVAVLADPVFEKNDSRIRGGSIREEKSDVVARGTDENTAQVASREITRAIEDIGGPAGSTSQLHRLLYTRKEAVAIQMAAPRGETLLALDFDASRTAALSPQLAQYKVVHFATHGLLDNRHPELSALVFSMVNKRGRTQNGLLSLEDIYNLRLPVNLVVLSACQTGLGKEIKGEGLIGLTRGFMYAGASRVVASLWKVDDVGTAKLMAEFYKEMEHDGKTPAAALRGAQIHLWKEQHWNSAYYWAAFEIQGEWR